MELLSYYFIQSKLLKLVVYVFVFPRCYNNFTPFVLLSRRRHLDNTTFLAFPKRVMLKRENIATFFIFSVTYTIYKGPKLDA